MGSPHRTPPPVWLLRVVWLLLPAALGAALADPLDGWSRAPRVTAEVLLWGAWAGGLLALLAPRPAGLTTLRVASGAALALAVVTASVAGAPVAAVAVGLAASPSVAEWLANGVAYGHERRIPLRTPPVIVLVLAPLAALGVAAGLATGPLLLADGRLASGVPVLVAGLAAAAVALRSLHALSRRWLVRVPGGLVVHDPLTLAHPVLLPRRGLAGVSEPIHDAVDLRLGVRGGVTLELSEPVPLPVIGRDRLRVEMVMARAVTVAPARGQLEPEPGGTKSEPSRA